MSLRLKRNSACKRDCKTAMDEHHTQTDPVMTEELSAEYREAFGLHDRNRDGLITYKELGALLRSMGQNPTEEELWDMITSVDVNRSGAINVDAFLRMMSTRHSATDEVHDIIDAFRVFDKKNNGFISAVEFKTAMVTLGEGLSDVEVDTMFKAANIDIRGKIYYKETVRAMSRGYSKEAPQTLQLQPFRLSGCTI